MTRSWDRLLDSPIGRTGDGDDDTRATARARFDRQLRPDGRRPLAHHLEAHVAGRSRLRVEPATVVLDRDRDIATMCRYLYAKRLGTRVMCCIRECLLHDAKAVSYTHLRAHETRHDL